MSYKEQRNVVNLSKGLYVVEVYMFTITDEVFCCLLVEARLKA